MPTLIIGNMPDAVHRALRLRAARHGRTAESEALAILEAAIKRPSHIKLGSVLARIGQRVQLTDQEARLFNQRNKHG